jgi:hypothetical protein
MPDLQKLHDRHVGRGFTVAGISVDEKGAAAVRPFLVKNRYSYPLLLDARAETAAAYRVHAIPALFLLDKEGRIVRQWVGTADKKEIERAVAGRRVESLGRRGKYLVWSLEDGLHLVMHLRMTGTLLYASRPAVLPPHARVRFALDDGGGAIHTAAQITGKAASMGEGVVVSVLDGLIAGFTRRLKEI